MKEHVISDGQHMLSGVCEVSILDEYDGGSSDGILITIDGDNYAAYTNSSDGYRSYGSFYKTVAYAQKNKFPPQPVIVSNWDQDEYDIESGMTYIACGIDILNLEGELILRVGTDHTDNYYPMAIFKYNPQNLPINKGRSMDEPGVDYDIDKGFAVSDNISFDIKKVTATQWEIMEHLVRENIKQKFLKFLAEDFDKYNTNELLSMWEEFNKNLK